MVMNREIATLRGSLFGIPAVTRAAESEARIREALRRRRRAEGEHARPWPKACWCSINGALMFAITPDDTLERTLSAARAERAAPRRMLQRVIEESRESAT